MAEACCKKKRRKTGLLSYALFNLDRIEGLSYKGSEYPAL
jgi:hypothetical protein